MPVLQFLKNLAERDVINPVEQGIKQTAGNVYHSPIANAIRTGVNYVEGNQQGTSNAAQATKLSFLQGLKNAPAQIAGSGGEAGLEDISPNNLLDSETAAKLAKLENPQQISKNLTPTVGQPVADKVAQAVAQTKDPNIAQNIVRNGVNEALPPPETPQATPVGNETIPAPQGTGTPFFTRANELGAVTKIHDTLNEGGTVDAAMNSYMEATGKTYGEAQKAVGDVMGASSLDKSKVNASLNPIYDNIELPKGQSNDPTVAINNAKMAHNSVIRAGNEVLQEVDKLNPHDHALMDQLRGNNPEDIIKQANDPAQFRKAAETSKQYNDMTQALGAYLGQDIPYRQQYGASMLFDQSPENEAAMADAKAKLPTQPGYTKGRFFKNYDEAAQFGVKRANENFGQDIAYDMQRRASNLSKLAMDKALGESYEGQVSHVNAPDVPPGYAQLRVPYGDNIMLPKSVADTINERMPAPDTKGFWAGYDTVNSNLKNIKLGGGLFHSLSTMGTYVGQKLLDSDTYLHPVKTAEDFGNVLKTSFSDKAFAQTMQDMANRGKLLDADASGLKYSRSEVSADVASNTPLLKQLHEAVFGRQIPTMKLQEFDRLTEGLDRNNPEDLTKMTNIAKELNQNYGGLNRDIQGLTPKTFQKMARGFLSTDYTEGQISTLIDAFKKGGPEGNLARQTVFGKALLFGGLATIGGVAGGEFNGQSPRQVALDILNKFIDPSFKIGGYTASLPATPLSLVGKPVEKSIAGAQSGNPLAGLKTQAQDFASARLAGVPSLIEQGVSNRNFYGQPIYGTDTHGRPISAGTIAENAASTLAPIPINQAVQTATGNESIPAAIANEAGLKVTPTNKVTSLPIEQQTYISTLQKSLPPEQAKPVITAITNFDAIIKQNSNLRTKVDTQINKDIAQGNMDKAKADANAFNQKLYQAISKAITPATEQYLNLQVPGAKLKTPYQYLNGNIYGYFTNLNLNQRKTTIRNNPTKFGLKIGDAIP